MSVTALIVDDSRSMRMIIRRVLGMCALPGTTCLEAEDGQVALDILERERVDLIITDLSMPRMDGELFLMKVRERESLKSIPIVVLSSNQSLQLRAQIQELGVRKVLAKPILPESLAAAIREIYATAIKDATSGSQGFL